MSEWENESEYRRGEDRAGYGTPDWNSKDQVQGWNDGNANLARLEAERMESLRQESNRNWEEANRPFSDSSASTDPWSTSSATPSTGSWTYNNPEPWPSSSNSNTSSEGSGWGLLILLLGLVGFGGGHTGYSYALKHHYSELGVWLTSGGGALGAVLVGLAVIALVVGTVVGIFYVLKSIVIATWWLTVKIFWLTIIVGGATAAGWAVTVASCRWLGVCRFFFAT